MVLLPDRVEADNGRERHSTYGPHESRWVDPTLLTLSREPHGHGDLLPHAYHFWQDHIMGYMYISRHLSLDVKLLALLVCVQLPPKLRDDLTIDVPFVSVNLLISHRLV